MEGRKRIEYFDIRDDAKRSKDSGELEPDAGFQVGKDAYSCLDLASVFCLLFLAIAKK